MPFQSEKQRRYLHANHPEIAKRWEKEYAHGGILDINESEEIIFDDGNDIELTAYNAAFDDPNDLSTGVKTLFMKKGGQAIGGGSIQGEPREDRTGFRNPHQDSYSSGQSYSGSTSSGGHPHGGVASQYSGSTKTSSPSTGSGRTRIQEEKQKEFQKQQIKDVTKGTLSDPDEKYDTWDQQYQDIPGTSKTSLYKSKVNVDYRRDLYEQALANQKAKMKKMGLLKLIPAALVLIATQNPKLAMRTFSLSQDDMVNLVKHSLPVMNAKKELIAALTDSKTAHLQNVDIFNPNEMVNLEETTDFEDIMQELTDLTKKPEGPEDTKGDGPEVVPITEEIQEYEQMASQPMSLLDRRNNPALYAALSEKWEKQKLAKEQEYRDYGLLPGDNNPLMLQANSGGLANLFRVKNQ